MATSARLEELQQKFNENPRRYFAPLANEHRKLGDLDQAIALCRTHLPQQPQHVSGHIVLAQALFEAGNTPDARRTFEVALDLDPENLIALRYLGDIARSQGEHLTARQWYERVLDADPRNDEIAQLIREVEQGAPAPRAAVEAAEPAQETPGVEPAAIASGDAPNEAIAQATAESPGPAPIEDLATAWEHEVEALEAPSELPVAAAASEEAVAAASELEPIGSAEPTGQYPEQELVSETAPVDDENARPEPAFSAEPEVAPAETMESAVASTGAEGEPNESWAEPHPDFVAALPAESPAPSPAQSTFREIDYSVFEAVADEEPAAPAQLEESFTAETPAQPVAELEESVAAFEAPAASEHPAADDWFAAPSSREMETLAADAPGESAFDLDAAFQQVLPNNGETVAPEIEPFELPKAALLPEFGEAVASDSQVSGETFAEAEFALPAIESSDGVDDAFAELDRITAGADAAAEGRGMLLPDEQYASSAPTEEVEAPQHVDALIGRTPDSGVPVVEEPPAAFVTETMAELYLQQGFREEALAVYRQLLAMNPDDAVLASRVASLEGQETAAPAASLGDSAVRYEAPAPARPDALGQSVRSFLGMFARRRAPMRRREPVRQQPEVVAEPDSPLGALFGAPQETEEASAAVLAGAFAPNGEAAPLPGRPTRAADEELRLGDVFGSAKPASGARAATFDEFFSSGSAEQPAQSPLDEEGSDMVQFTAWLEGLKKK